MKTLTIIFAAIILQNASGLAQTPAPPKVALSQPTPKQSEEEIDRMVQRWEAREKSVRAALKLSQPEQRIVALRKLLNLYPDDKEVPAIVEEGILDTYIKYRPSQTAKILAQIDKVLKPIPESFKTGSGNNIYNRIAVKLVEAKILLTQAHELADKGLAVFDAEKFIEAQKKKVETFAQWIARNKNVEAVLNTEPISDEEMLRRVSAERAKALTIVGRVYLAEARTAEAKRILNEAYSANPDINEANIALAEISSREGNNESVVDYLSSVAVRIPLKSEIRQQLETAYRKTHGGSLAGLEEMLDARYRLLMPNPIKPAPYKPTASRTRRMVLAEVFTGAGCVPCVGSDLAFEAAIDRYTRKNLVLLMYHLHRPLPDPMVNPSAISRALYYGIGMTPTFVIDGEKDNRGGALREKTRIIYDRIEPIIEKRLETTEDASIELDAVLEGNLVKVKATVDGLKTPGTNLRLRIVLVEGELRYSGENLVRIHPMVVRSLAGLHGGFTLKPRGATVVEHTFEIEKISAELKAYLEEYEVKGDYGPMKFKEHKYQIDKMNLSVVALVQDEVSKRVLQSAYSPAKPRTATDKRRSSYE